MSIKREIAQTTEKKQRLLIILHQKILKIKLSLSELGYSNEQINKSIISIAQKSIKIPSKDNRQGAILLNFSKKIQDNVLIELIQNFDYFCTKITSESEESESSEQPQSRLKLQNIQYQAQMRKQIQKLGQLPRCKTIFASLMKKEEEEKRKLRDKINYKRELYKEYLLHKVMERSYRRDHRQLIQELF